MNRAGGGASEWDKDAAAFLRDILAALKTKEAIEVATKAIEYFRGTDYVKHVIEHSAEIESKHKELCSKAGVTNTAADSCDPDLAQKLGQYLITHGFIVRTEHAPLPGLDQSKIPPHLQDNARWPRRVRVARDRNFDISGFYAINYEASSAYSMTLLGGTIAIVLLFCLFPIWPFGAKKLAWYSLVALMTVLIICIILRLILFILLWYCGRDFWFLPNLFDEDAGVLESFIPLYSYKKRDDDWIMIAARVLAALMTAASFYKLGETHSLADISDVGVGAFLDILEWGNTKLGGNTTAIQASQNFEALLTPEERLARHYDICAKHCEFRDVEEFQEFCLTDCPCLNELWQSKCWRSCEYDVQDDLKQRLKACKTNPNARGAPVVPSDASEPSDAADSSDAADTSDTAEPDDAGEPSDAGAEPDADESDDAMDDVEEPLSTNDETSGGDGGCIHLEDNPEESEEETPRESAGETPQESEEESDIVVGSQKVESEEL